eukprot:415103-Rhodomonas_salina.1
MADTDVGCAATRLTALPASCVTFQVRRCVYCVKAGTSPAPLPNQVLGTAVALHKECGRLSVVPQSLRAHVPASNAGADEDGAGVRRHTGGSDAPAHPRLQLGSPFLCSLRASLALTCAVLVGSCGCGLPTATRTATLTR